MTLAPVDWFVCLGVVSGSILFGLYIARRKHAAESSSQFFLAGRSLTWPVVGASLFATNIGAEHLVGLSGDAYRYGLSAGTVELSACLCIGFATAALFPYYIRNKVFTVPEFLELRYHPGARIAFSALMLVIAIMTKMAFHLYAGALVLHGIAGWNVMSAVWVMGAIAAVVTITGGFTAVAYTDSIQTGIMVFGGAVMTIAGLREVGGWHGLAQRVPDAIHIAKPYNDLHYPFVGVILAAIYAGIFYWGIDQVNVQRVLGARDLQHARWGAMFATFLKLSPVFIFALPGVIALALYPGRDSRTTFVTLMEELLPAGLRGLLLAALLASLISSTLSVMNSVSTLAVRDFAVRINPRLGERKQVLLGRVAIVLAALLGIIAAYLVYKTPGGLYLYLQTISIYLVMPITPAIVFGIFSKRVNIAGAVSSVVVGCGMAALFVTDQLLGEAAGARLFPWLHRELTFNYTYRGFWGTLVCSAVLFGVSWLTRPQDSAKLEGLTINWRGRLEPWDGLRDWRLHLGVLGAITVALYAFLW